MVEAQEKRAPPPPRGGGEPPNVKVIGPVDHVGELKFRLIGAPAPRNRLGAPAEEWDKPVPPQLPHLCAREVVKPARRGRAVRKRGRKMDQGGRFARESLKLPDRAHVPRRFLVGE